jgi:hypothetical protein
MRNGRAAITIAMICFLLFLGKSARPDTFRLSDGTVVICKIIEETEDHYVIANSYGTFTVRKKNVKEKYVTRSYKEDVKIQQKLNIQVNEDNVKKNIEEGQRLKKLKEEEERIRKRKEGPPPGVRAPDWFFGRIGVTAAYYATVSPSIREKVPGGLSMFITFDQGFEGPLRKGNMALPGLRIEAGFLDLERKGLYTSAYRVSGFVAQAGPFWAFPALENKWGSIVAGALPGFGWLEAYNRDVSGKRSGPHFTLTALAGYEYSFRPVSIAVNVRYLFIMDGKHPYHGIGGSVGFTYRLWNERLLK